MQLIDFHRHLDLYPNFSELIKSCEQEKIYTLAVTTTPRAWSRNNELTKNTKYVRPALGFHPQLVSSNYKSELELWEKYLEQAKYIGEIGIDANKNYIHTLPLQIKIFRHILMKCSITKNKVLSIHSIKATRLVLDSLEELFPQENGTTVLHWFTGTQSEAQRAIKLGCYFSINPMMTRTKKGQELIKSLPINRILTETDGPFVNYNIADTIDALAKIKIQTADFISAQIEKNFYKVIDRQDY